MYLDQYDRLLIIGVCCMFLLVCFLIMVCKLSPWCWCHKYCPIRAHFEDDEKKIHFGAGENYQTYKDAPNLKSDREDSKSPASSTGTTALPKRTSQLRESTKKRKEIYNYSSDDSAAEGFPSPHTRRKIMADKRKWSFTSQLSDTDDPSDASAKSVLDLVRGEIFLLLEFQPDKNRLKIRIEKVTNLSGRMKRKGKVAVKVQSLCARSTIDRLVSLFQRLQLSSEELDNDLTHEAYTRARDPTTNISFGETLDIPLKQSEKDRFCLRFICFAYDKMAKEVPLCEALLPLREVGDESDSLIIRPLTRPQKEEKGKLNFAISYLPTSQKLSVTQIAATNLKLSHGEIPNSVVFVKFALQRRGIHSKKRVHGRKASPDVTWEESVNFDLPREHVREVSMVISVKQLITYSSELGEHAQEYPIGKLVIGAGSGSPRAQAQWGEMLQNPRQSVANWHTLF